MPIQGTHIAYPQVALNRPPAGMLAVRCQKKIVRSKYLKLEII